MKVHIVILKEVIVRKLLMFAIVVCLLFAGCTRRDSDTTLESNESISTPTTIVETVSPTVVQNSSSSLATSTIENVNSPEANCIDETGGKIAMLSQSRPSFIVTLGQAQMQSFGFNLEVFESIRFEISSEFDSVIDLYRVRNCELLLSDDVAATDVFEFISYSDDSYFIRVRGYSSSASGDYTLSYEKNVFNNPSMSEMATPIVQNCPDTPTAQLPALDGIQNPITLTLTDQAIHDFGIRLDAFEPARFTIESDFDAVISIHDVETCEVLIVDDVSNTDEFDFFPSSNGEYFVRVRGYSSSNSGQYTLEYFNTLE